MFLALSCSLHVLSLDPCSSMLVYNFFFFGLDLHVLCFRCLDLLFLMCWCLGLHTHMLDIMSPATPCLDLLVCIHVLCSYTYVSASHACLLGFVFFHAFMLTSTCLDVLLHANMHISMLICVDRWSLHALCRHLCACVLHALFMCLGLDLVCHAMCYCSPSVYFITFSCVLA